MTTATMLDTEVDLQRKYTEEERDAMYDACMRALEKNDQKEADRILSMMPIHPRWAKITAEVYGREFAQENFNLTHADEVYGEGWLDELKKE